MKMLSVIIPAYNESENLSSLHNSLSTFLDKICADHNIGFEILYVNDGSKDDTLEVLRNIASRDKNVRYVNFSRNFGKEAATTCGYRECKGDAAIVMDADGQHPKEIIGSFLDKWEIGAQVVVGVRRSTKANLFKRASSKLFYTLLGSVDGGEMIPGSTDFRLLDRKVIAELNKLSERNRITRGLIDWLGFTRDYVYFDANERNAGTASYSFKKLFVLAMHTFVSQSTKPLQVSGALGGIVTFISLLVLGFVFVEQFLMGDPLRLAFTGTAILGFITSLLVGVVLICIGLLALYIESIHTETQNRPLYVVESKK